MARSSPYFAAKAANGATLTEHSPPNVRMRSASYDSMTANAFFNCANTADLESIPSCRSASSTNETGTVAVGPSCCARTACKTVVPVTYPRRACSAGIPGVKCATMSRPAPCHWGQSRRRVELSRDSGRMVPILSAQSDYVSVRNCPLIHIPHLPPQPGSHTTGVLGDHSGCSGFGGAQSGGGGPGTCSAGSGGGGGSALAAPLKPIAAAVSPPAMATEARAALVSLMGSLQYSLSGFCLDLLSTLTAVLADRLGILVQEF